MNKKNLLLVLVAFLAVIIGVFLGNLLADRSKIRDFNSLSSMISSSHESKIDEILSMIDSKYVDSTDVKKLSEDITIDLVSKLDPHSVYIPAADLEKVNSELEGSFSGIGVQFNIQNDTIMVVSVISGGPSEKVGILAGDRIVKVNDTIFAGKNITNEKVMKKLRGKESSKVQLAVKRYGTKQLLKYTVTRGKIPVNSVDIAYMIDPGVGFIKVNKFAETTYSEFLNAIADLRAKGAKKYIVDLRENSGGLMDRAIDMINEFLPADRLIVYAQGKAYKRFEARSDGKGSCINAPLVVLIDEFSASASEIFSGAIQDNDRGLIIGRRSFGKGLVQQQYNLSDGSALRLTVARYYTPSGRSIQKPYVKGKADEYENDIMKRYLHGEFDNKDSIRVADTLKYKTLKGRSVYGGGGIMPDIFVPRDTSSYSPYYNNIINMGFLYQFAFKYTDANRAKLKAFKTWQEMDSYLSSQNLLNPFIDYAAAKGVKPNITQIQKSSKLILQQLHAYISRNLLGDSGFYPLFFRDDITVKKALAVIHKQQK